MRFIIILFIALVAVIDISVILSIRRDDDDGE